MVESNIKKEEIKINWLLFPFQNIYFIFLNFINGVVYVFFRLPKNIFDIISFRLDKTYRNFSGTNNSNINHKPMNSNRKTYKYSSSTLAKLEKEREILINELQDPNATRSKEAVTFVYKAKTPEGKIITDTINGFSKAEVNTFLVNEGYEVYSIKTSKSVNFLYGGSTMFQPKMSVKDLIFWLTQLSTYLKAGITLAESVRILSKQMGRKNRHKLKALQSLSYELTVGESFSTAMEKQGKMFPSLLINMVRAAEATGTLIETLDDMANYYTEIDKTKKQMVSAMTYPTIITVFALAVVVFIIVFVIPQFVDIYESSNIEIPGITRFIINLSEFLINNGLFIILGIVLFVIIMAVLYKNVQPIRAFFQNITMRIPIVGKIIIYNEITIFTKTFASLLKNNVFITNSMEILSKITNNEVYKEIMANTIDNIVRGNKISESFNNHWAIPDVAYYMIVTGESTGELAEMMQKVSEYYQDMHRNIVGNLKNFIEPIMISSLALIVGGILLAVIVPMFQMYSAI
ncbi:MAG: type II secretion system F family protein [Bacilli bacterium]|nr:type II secretion system F family protein [Bacilli bacterium]